MATATTSTLEGHFETGDRPTASNFQDLIRSCNNTDITVSSATSTAIDLTSVVSSHKVITTGTLAADIKLPQATAANAGITITVMFSVDCATDGSVSIGFAESGSTVMAGVVHVFSDTADKNMSIVIPASSKLLEFDADENSHCGGAEGTVATFTYYGANLVFAEVRGFTTSNTVALDSNVASGTGWS